MQLSAPTLPYDPPAASAADPALAADRASRATNSAAPADGFGAMLVAESNPPPPAKTAANTRNPSSPLGATGADADETDPTTESGTEPAAPASLTAGEGAPDATTLANWLAANAVLAPIPTAPATDSIGLELAPGAPDATGGVEGLASTNADLVCAGTPTETGRFGAVAASAMPGSPATGATSSKGPELQTQADVSSFQEPASRPAGMPNQAAPSAPATGADDATVTGSAIATPPPTPTVRYGRFFTQNPAVAALATVATEAGVAATTLSPVDGSGLSPDTVGDSTFLASGSDRASPASGKPQIQPAAVALAGDTQAALTMATALGEPSASTTEKFAALQERFLRRYSIGEKTELKKSIDTDVESVVGPSSALGINAAKPVTAMSALTLTPSSDAAERVSAVPAPLTFDALVKDAATLPATGMAHTASRAVDSVMAIADHFGTGGQRAVSLQFSVSGVELAVHVELRGNAVHTTFRTDSPELRAALAAEWQNVNPANSGNRSQWLAEPVFASGSSGNGTSGQTGSGFQQHADARQGQPFAEEIARLRTPQRATTSSALPAAATPTIRPVVSAPGRLHVFA